jgi:hypothetical protein
MLESTGGATSAFPLHTIAIIDDYDTTSREFKVQNSSLKCLA